MNDVFSDNPAFNVAALTAAINILPNRYGKLQEMNLFPAYPITTRSAMIEWQHHVLSLLPTRALGSPGTVGTSGERKLRSFSIPHIPHDDMITPESVAGLRAFGSESQMTSVAIVVNQHLETMRRKHDITLEWLRWGALRGLILDANGVTLYNLFDIFEETQVIQNWELDVDTTDVKQKCIDLSRYYELNLLGETMSGVHVFVSPKFFDELTNHATVKTAYERYNANAHARSDLRKRFEFAGITFEEHAGQAQDVSDPANPITRKFIDDGYAHAFPLGTTQTFRTYFAPADFNETVNTMGQPIYVKTKPHEFDRGVAIHTQSNPLPICMQPRLLVQLKWKETP